GVEHEVRQVVRGNEPSQDLIEVANEVNADFIVIGLRRRTPVGKLILGSNAQRILLDASCPVLAVKAALNDGLSLLSSTGRLAPGLGIAGAVFSEQMWQEQALAWVRSRMNLPVQGSVLARWALSCWTCNHIRCHLLCSCSDERMPRREMHARAQATTVLQTRKRKTARCGSTFQGHRGDSMSLDVLQWSSAR